MIVKSLKFIVLFIIGLVFMQLLFRSEINWVDIIGVSISTFLLYVLFEWISQRKKGEK